MSHSETTDTPTETPTAYGFAITAGTLAIRLGYKVNGDTFYMFATTQIGDARPQIWRQFTTTRENAEAAASNLAADAEEYAEATKCLIRPSEDLDLYDFVEHVALTVRGEMH